MDPSLGIKRSERREAQRNLKGNVVCVAVRNLGSSKCILLIRILIITELQKHSCECLRSLFAPAQQTQIHFDVSLYEMGNTYTQSNLISENSNA